MSIKVPVPKFYGYRLADGSMHVKRYVDPDDLLEASHSLEVVKVTDAFEAATPEAAVSIATRLLLQV